MINISDGDEHFPDLERRLIRHVDESSYSSINQVEEARHMGIRTNGFACLVCCFQPGYRYGNQDFNTFHLRLNVGS